MNFALTTFLVFVFLLPGLVFRRLYYTEEFSKQYFKQNFFELFVSSFIPSIILHLLVTGIVMCFGYRIDLTLVGEIISSKDYSESAYLELQNDFSNIVSYHTILFSLAIISGYLSKKVVRGFRLDRRRKLFRFQNYWHYLFRGEFFDFPRAAFDLRQDEINDIELIYVDLLIDTADGTIIYDGILVDYELGADNGLESLSIKEVQRRAMKDDHIVDSNGNPVSGYYDIPGHVMIFPCKNILNYNLSFYRLEKFTIKDDKGLQRRYFKPVLVQ